jgi:hypothetical protein
MNRLTEGHTLVAQGTNQAIQNLFCFYELEFEQR